MVSVQNWLGESEDAKKNAATPGWVNIGMSCKFLLMFPGSAKKAADGGTVMALATSYLPLFLPPTGKAAQSS